MRPRLAIKILGRKRQALTNRAGADVAVRIRGVVVADGGDRAVVQIRLAGNRVDEIVGRIGIRVRFVHPRRQFKRRVMAVAAERDFVARELLSAVKNISRSPV